VTVTSFSYSPTSRSRLDTCHPDLVRLFEAVLKKADHTVLEGLRSDEQQFELYRQGKSTLDGVTKRSKHQGVPHARDMEGTKTKVLDALSEWEAGWIDWDGFEDVVLDMSPEVRKSLAVDVAPYDASATPPIDWRIDRPEVEKRWLDFVRTVLETADELGISVRWGGDWDGDWDRQSDPTSDQRFNDWPHWELR